MVSENENTPLKLRPEGLYVVVSQAETKPNNDEAVTNSTSTNNGHNNLEWGLYWSKSDGIGQSYRYKERNGDWQFERTGVPSVDPTHVSIESNQRVILALHIENMHQSMASLLEDRLGPERFEHSHPFRPRSKTQGQGDANGEGCEKPKERSRKWLGHALVTLNDMGFISLTEGTRSAALIEGEALERATRNMASSPPKRTVERSQNVIFDGKGLDGETN